MKNRNWIRRGLAFFMTLALLASSALPASAAQTGSQNALAGVNISITDTTTPATMFGFKGKGGFRTWNRMGAAVYRHGATILFER